MDGEGVTSAKAEVPVSEMVGVMGVKALLRRRVFFMPFPFLPSPPLAVVMSTRRAPCDKSPPLPNRLMDLELRASSWSGEIIS